MSVATENNCWVKRAETKCTLCQEECRWDYPFLVCLLMHFHSNRLKTKDTLLLLLLKWMNVNIKNIFNLFRHSLAKKKKINHWSCYFSFNMKITIVNQKICQHIRIQWSAAAVLLLYFSDSLFFVAVLFICFRWQITPVTISVNTTSVKWKQTEKSREKLSGRITLYETVMLSLTMRNLWIKKKKKTQKT